MLGDHKSLIIINLGKGVQLLLQYICVGIINKRQYAIQHNTLM